MALEVHEPKAGDVADLARLDGMQIIAAGDDLVDPVHAGAICGV
jgi:hypothetical protein